MIYLTIEDLRGLTREDIDDSIVDDERSIYNTIEGGTLSLIDSYISGLYNTHLEYIKEKSLRNSFLVRIAVDIFAYDLYTRATVAEMSDIRQIRYDRALDMLKQIASGDINIDLPKKDTENDPTAVTPSLFGSNTKNNTQW